ncbi:MAG TPA: YSC84-related protein [Gammaproteobacteria bacterium]|nr:YSC84-related protein [Gammaproteobacteria bacterium]
MKAFTNFALATLAAVTLAGLSAQDRQGDPDALDANSLTERRQEILNMSKATIDKLRKDQSAAGLIGSAYGHAVFDTTKGGFIVTGAGGTGVAMRKNGANPVYMHMGEGGVGLGAGLENYKLVVVFESEDTYKRFIDGAWTAGTSAQAAAGTEGAAAVGKFVNGVAVYRLTDRGLIAQADVTGVKFWPSDRLNPGAA